MSDESPPASPQPDPAALPPVEPPSATFILQLFIVPGVLVAVIVAIIVLFFGWVGGGPQTPEQYLQGLRSPSGMKRGKTAQDLAQVLPRSAELRGKVNFALDLADLLADEIKKPPTVADPTGQEPFLLEYYLPSAAASFQAPVALPLLVQMVLGSQDRVGSDEAYRQRMRNAVFALALMGSRVQEFDSLASQDQERILSDLDEATRASDPQRAERARLALEYLRQRGSRDGRTSVPVLPAGLVSALEAASSAPDEITRKFAVLACANWEGPETERLLVQLTRGQDDIPDTGFETGDRPFRPEDRVRGIWEIRHNAALALARRGSDRTPWELVRETLDEETLVKQRYADNPGVAVSWILKAIKDLDHLRQHRPEVFHAQTDVVADLKRLAIDSPTVAIRVEAQKLLDGTPEAVQVRSRTSREMLLIVGVGVSVLLLLGLAVFARWRRAAA
ncbi:MAG: hypothetical protein NZM31_02030 [Gemmatales bacterium]|nr:hypothetical protein [Gemmatales bacterium]MDW8385776.1 hypothetical protein [Gemmatales bacterium]